MFLQNVKCLCYCTLRYITWGWKTCIKCSLSRYWQVTSRLQTCKCSQ